MKLDSPLLLSLIALLCIVVLLAGILVFRITQTRKIKRPEWDRMLADTDYFRKAMIWVFKRRGFQASQFAVLPVQYTEGPREVLFKLEKNGKTYAALCGRWVAAVGSDQILRFQGN